MAVEYQILRDAGLKIIKGPGVTIDFELPQSTRLNGANRPFIQFSVRRTEIISLNDTIRLKVDMNGHRIENFKMGAERKRKERVVQEVISGGANFLDLGGNNVLHFEIVNGSSEVTVSDIVLWYHTR